MSQNIHLTVRLLYILLYFIVYFGIFADFLAKSATVPKRQKNPKLRAFHVFSGFRLSVRPGGFEPSTPGVGGLCSIQLSYERICKKNNPVSPMRDNKNERAHLSFVTYGIYVTITCQHIATFSWITKGTLVIVQRRATHLLRGYGPKHLAGRHAAHRRSRFCMAACVLQFSALAVRWIVTLNLSWQSK